MEEVLHVWLVELTLERGAGLKNHGAAISRDGRFFGAATFTSDVRLSEVQFSRTGEFRGVQKVMDLKKAHAGQVCVSFSGS